MIALRIISIICLLFMGNLSSAQGFVLVELFTSQGCSSCPPADKVLESLKNKYHNDEFYALSYHVDYWNRLGWKDPYSKAEFSERQRWYASKLDGKVYTPELVINGAKGIVGSRSADAENLVKSALKDNLSSKMEANYTEINGKLNITYKADGIKDGMTVAVALVQNNVGNDVPRGENGGKNLRHVNVVREFAQDEAKKAGTLALEVTKSLSEADRTLIIFIQNPATGEVLAATQAKKEK